MFFKRKTQEFYLKFVSINYFSINLNGDSKSGVKVINFNEDKNCFFMQSLFYSALSYREYIFSFKQIQEQKYFFSIKNENNKKIVSGNLLTENLDFDEYLTYLNDRNVKIELYTIKGHP